MKSSLRCSFLTPALVSLVALSLAGCHALGYKPSQQADDQPATASQPYNVEMAPVPPPVPSDEIRPVITDPMSYVWRPGHWIYENRQFTWVPGELMNRPSPTAVWSPDRWEKRAFGWVYVHGYWQ
jgi:hypothetical protein